MAGREVKKLAAPRRIRPSLHGLRYRLRLWLSPLAPSPERKSIAPPDEAFRQMSFTFAVIALSARVATADGALTQEKYVAFREAFPLKGHLCGKIRSLFTFACDDPTPPDRYIAQIKTMFPQRRTLFVSLVDRLSGIAAADGGISRAAERLLITVAQGLELNPSEYANALARHGRAPAHAVLGVDKHAGKKTIKKHYRELMRRYHPDRFAGDNLSPEMEMLLHLKTSEINAAYKRLRGRAA